MKTKNQTLHTEVFRWLITMACLLWTGAESSGQRVGVVLSGGGGTALAHVGFLKVLEANDIPVDYIAGTSMGAVIAAMYACGYSVAEIDSVVRSEEFLQMAEGSISEQLKFYFKNTDNDASIARVKYSNGELINNVLPANLINPVLLDWKLMEGFSQADAASNNNFDSLYIPFRCIAADVENKKQITFRNGPLNVAARASCTYPFYLPPRRVDGVLLYDGGIYNNFPSDMLYQEFLPDVILGCNVSGDTDAPTEDNIFSQLQSMILNRVEYKKLCELMLVVEPDVKGIGTFDFAAGSAAIALGERATTDSLVRINQMVARKQTLEEKTDKRMAFRKKFKPLVIEQVEITGLDKAQNNYVKKVFGRKNEPRHLSELKIPYFRVFDDDKIKSIFPIAILNPVTGKYNLQLDVKKERDLRLSFGGNFSSRSINTGFVGLQYNLFGATAATLSANSYFGRFYGSVNSSVRWDFPGSYPVALQAGFTFNRWDYFKSLATFFEDVKPSYILLNERFGNFCVTTPAGNKGVMRTEAIYALMFDEYYQTTEFLSSDTADRTEFEAGILRMNWERNTLNKKQYANKGTWLSISSKYVFGEETSLPGSTNPVSDTLSDYHQWFTFKFQYTNFFLPLRKFNLAFALEGIASTQDFFNNYSSSTIMAPSFTPVAESKTLFLPQFRAHNYASAGLIGVLSLTKSIDLRAEAYAFNAFGRIVPNQLKEAEYAWEQQQFFMGSGSFIFHSPLGPVSLSANYYDQKEVPWSFLFNFGYIIFNRSARD
ncbi:MAG: patatin-like phospholipase family protein [Flavobacteriales bacterium]